MRTIRVFVWVLLVILSGKGAQAETGHTYNAAGYCLKCKWEKSYIERTGRPCIDDSTAAPVNRGSGPNLGSEQKAPDQTKATPSLEIRDYLPPEPLGTAMENANQKAERWYARQRSAMQRIESFGLYAVATDTVDGLQLGDGSSGWTLERGETFPFLGFMERVAFVRLDNTWIAVPRNAINIFRLSDRPGAEATYNQIVSTYRANILAQRQLQALDESNARLRQLQQQQSNLQWQLEQNQQRILQRQRQLEGEINSLRNR